MTLSKKWLFSPTLTALSLILLLIVLLRIPSYTEPYWYGDEGIYLVIGNAMNHGAVLYKDIVDHKTPLIYYFARVGTQLNFRLLLTGWMVIASFAFFAIVLRISKRVWLSLFTTFGFVLMTSLPFLEGTIPNGELFVMGFVLVGLWIFLRTKSGLALLQTAVPEQRSIAPKGIEHLWWLLAGVCMGGALLTKVPALFDAGSLFLIGWLFTWDQQLATGRRFHWQLWWQLGKQWGLLLLGLVLPITLSIAYFMSIGAGKEYLDFGLLYNFHYVQNWSLGHLPGWGQTIFTLPMKALIVLAVLIKLTLLGKLISRPIRWATAWFYLALFASILSNRPYAHYLLQIVPPLLLLSGLVWHELTIKRKSATTHFARAATLGCVISSVLVLWLVSSSLRFGYYPVLSYYRSFFNLATGRTAAIDYRNSFNSYLADNYAAAQLLKSTDEPTIFIWGTNPMLYALSGKQPIGRFTVAFHIQDLNLYQETIDTIGQVSPQFIVVMKDEKTQLPGLDELLNRSYFPRQSYDHFTIWSKRQNITSPQQLPGQ